MHWMTSSRIQYQLSETTSYCLIETPTSSSEIGYDHTQPRLMPAAESIAVDHRLTFFAEFAKWPQKLQAHTHSSVTSTYFHVSPPRPHNVHF